MARNEFACKFGWVKRKLQQPGRENNQLQMFVSVKPTPPHNNCEIYHCVKNFKPAEKKRTFFKAFKQPLKRKQSAQIKIRRPGRLYGKPAFFGSTHCLQYVPTLTRTEDVTMATTVQSTHPKVKL